MAYSVFAFFSKTLILSWLANVVLDGRQYARACFRVLLTQVTVAQFVQYF
jgi:hypothetical protein